MDEYSHEVWADGFPDLVGHPEQYVLCVGKIGFDVISGVIPGGAPGLVIRLDLPDGRAALAGLELLGMVDGLLEALDQQGLRVTIGLADRRVEVEQSHN